jgi:hypothetical protein
MRLIIRLAMILFGAALVSAASAQPSPGGGPGASTAPSGLITQFNADQFAQILTAAGFSSKSGVASDNKTPIVVAQFWPNTQSIIYGTYCDNNGVCPAYQILIGFQNQQSIGDPWTDAWNSKFGFVKALKSGTDLLLVMDVMLAPGVTPDYVAASGGVFKTIVGNVSTFKP